MAPERLLGLALLIVLLLPSVIALTEHRRLHDGFRAVLALAGLGFCWMTGGGHGLLLGLCSGLGTLLLLTILVAFTQKLSRARLLSGGEIKQLASSAAWLTPVGALAYLGLVTVLALVGGLAGNRFNIFSRNEVLVIASSFALLLVFAIAQ